MENHLKISNSGKRGKFNRHFTRSTPPNKETLPPEPIYQEDVDNSTAQCDRDHRVRNEQLKNFWLNKCQRMRLREIFVLTGHSVTAKPFNLTNSVKARKVDGFLANKSPPFKLTKCQKNFCGTLLITSLLNKETYISTATLS